MSRDTPQPPLPAPSPSPVLTRGVITMSKEPKAKQMMPNDDPSDPLEKDGESCYLKFDGIVITNAPDAAGVKVEFKWRGKVTLWLMVEGVRIENDNILNLTGIEGRQLVKLT